ncbi:H339R protein [Faustovirus]|nr:H339R protein [Faustovirus]QJX73191.1 proliferating cell nuclear antigen [Faustovirus]QJX73698.1 proliferating cell nuclear antigen [Faustovirus]
MKRAIKRKVKLPVGSNTEDLAEMFNQILGTGSINLNIAYPRYARIKDLMLQTAEIIEIYADSPYMKVIAEFQQHRIEMLQFVKDCRAYVTEAFKFNFDARILDLAGVDDDSKKAFSESYSEIKKSKFVQTYIIMCDRLHVYKKHFEDAARLNHKFLGTISDSELCPFTFTNFNFKYAYLLPQTSTKVKEFMIMVLHKLYSNGWVIYEEITSPDVDVEEFANVIVQNIGSLKKQPELSRCQRAFKIILDSVNMLKSNFRGYYRDFIDTKSPTIIMEHFVLDVSKNTQADPELTQQFRQIITYYQKIAQNNVSNPQVRMLLEKVNESMRELDKQTENIVKIRASGSEPGNNGDDNGDNGNMPELKNLRL